MIFLIAFSIIYIVVEILYLIVRRNNMALHEKQTITSLHKFMEYNVLNMTLKNPITSEQASAYEYQKTFLRVEFVHTKPWLAYLFDLSECVTIGRSRDNKISIRDEALSRLHCKIYMLDGNIYLQDLGASNGTVVRGKWLKKVRLTTQESMILENGDTIRIGSYKLKVKFYQGWQAAA